MNRLFRSNEHTVFQVKRHRGQSSSSFFFLKDRDKVLNAYHKKRKQDNERRAGALNGEGATEQNEDRVDPGVQIRVCEDFPQRVIKARSNLYPFLRSSIDIGREAYLKYDRLYVDRQAYVYDYDLQRPVPVLK